jgi:L-2-hydroxyglutarate oxidase LhgO
MNIDVEIIVIGAGVVGLAIARRLALAGKEVLVLEAEDHIGTHTSSRNSEVIHAGIYYPTGSLKAQLCVKGREALYRYCADRAVPAKAIGKVIVAVTEAEISALHALKAKAVANGVTDLTWLDPPAVSHIEPEIICKAALFSPSSGIVDSHALMLSLQGEAESHGAQLVFRTRVESVTCLDSGFDVRTTGADDMTLRCAILVNAAAFNAPLIAARMDGYPKSQVPRRYFAKGNYLSVSGATPFRHLIYPLPVAGGLGVHVTLDLAGRMRLGPDLHWVDGLDYAADTSITDAFYEAVRLYWPSVMERELHWTYSGIRPKISGPGEDNADFVVDGPADHGVAGLVNLFGIESPGLTSSLALAELVAQKLGFNA